MDTDVIGLLEAGDWDPQRLRAHLAEVGTPLVRPVPDQDRVDVTFVYDAGDEVADGTVVRLRALIERALPTDEDALTLQHVPGTPIHHLTLRLPADLRFGYGFAVQDTPDARPHLADDPTNRHRDPRDARLSTAIAVLPDAAELHRPADVTPHLRELVWDSDVLGVERPVWLSLPPGSPAEDLCCVVVFDGAARHTAPHVRDGLGADGIIRPTVVVLVDEAGRRRDELTGNAAFSRALAEELLPLVRTEVVEAGGRLSEDPADVALSGSSFGGLCAGWTALHHPEVFGTAIMQSPSCWYHTEPPGVGGVPTPLLIEAFRQLPPAPVRLWQECGELEFGPPPAQVWQALGNRWLHDVLVARGYDTVYREYRGGHVPAWWRGTWADALSWAFPAS
jgi:enterochelin esterase-like enzyme